MREAIPSNRPCYSLTEVRKLALEGEEKVLIQGNAAEDAYHCFRWESADILNAIKKLKIGHFYKSMPSRAKPGVMLDVYRAENLNGENVYTHFYINPGTCKLVINSFKEYIIY